MARNARKEENQIDLFPVEPIIGALAITEFKTSGAEIRASLSGVTNVNDVARIDAPCWQAAVADWLITLHQGNVDDALIGLKKAYVRYVNLNAEPHRETPTGEVILMPTDRA